MLKEFQYQLLHKEDLASLAKAFYYLNRCSVNNLYRVNGEGNYTVCLKSPDKITKIPPIKITADDLSHITFTNKDYSEVYFPKKYTLIYADPPGFYPDSMESTRTLSRGFSTWKCQIKLLNFLARYIDTHPIIYTNVYSDRLYNVLRRAFTYYKLEILERPRHINPKGNTEPVKLIYAKNF
jgi:site-specific DNA-adenine methylase